MSTKEKVKIVIHWVTSTYSHQNHQGVTSILHNLRKYRKVENKNRWRIRSRIKNILNGDH